MNSNGVHNGKKDMNTTVQPWATHWMDFTSVGQRALESVLTQSKHACSLFHPMKPSHWKVRTANEFLCSPQESFFKLKYWPLGNGLVQMILYTRKCGVCGCKESCDFRTKKWSFCRIRGYADFQHCILLKLFKMCHSICFHIHNKVIKCAHFQKVLKNFSWTYSSEFELCTRWSNRCTTSH